MPIKISKLYKNKLKGVKMKGVKKLKKLYKSNLSNIKIFSLNFIDSFKQQNGAQTYPIEGKVA
jgi:hypothetical protein